MSRGRDQAPNLVELRRLAFTDIDQAVCAILKQTLDYLGIRAGRLILPQKLLIIITYRNVQRIRKDDFISGFMMCIQIINGGKHESV